MDMIVRAGDADDIGKLLARRQIHRYPLAVSCLTLLANAGVAAGRSVMPKTQSPFVRFMESLSWNVSGGRRAAGRGRLSTLPIL